MIEGKHVILRLFTERDLDEFLKLEQAYSEIGEFSTTDFRSPAQFRKEFSETGGWGESMGRMLVTNKEGRLLGHIMFVKDPTYQAGYEVGYGIFRRQDRGHDYMTEALRMFSAYLFESKPIPRLQLTTAVDNAAARRIAEKCGYQHEGTMRRMVFCRGEYVDAARYSLLREECPTLAQVLAS
jgi:RimJ/RimL family protein N-acetyltransferase